MQERLEFDAAKSGAVIAREAALVGILFQIDLISKGLSDTSIYISTILIALFSAAVLLQKKIKGIEAVVIFLLVPFAARFLIALPRFFSMGSLGFNIAADSLLLTFDRNNFVSRFPFYYAAITTFFALSSLKALRVFALVDCLLLALIFVFCSSGDIKLYSLPITLICVFAFLLLLELSALLLSIPKTYAVTKKERGLSFGLLLGFTLCAGLFLLLKADEGFFGSGGQNGLNKGSIPEGSGLIRPQLLNFDLTPNLNLHTEVSTGNELMLIVRKDNIDDNHILLRRFILSAYNSEKIEKSESLFTRDSEIDEENQREKLPASSADWTIEQYKKRSSLKQEYYIKNIDEKTFLAINEPFSITQYENYDESSFKNVYAVQSAVSNASYMELLKAALKYKDDPYFGMRSEDFVWYTAFANGKNGISETEKKIQDKAVELTSMYNNNMVKAASILDYLKNGDFRYSLKPGIAPDGNQLSHFLFNSKRGYCTYFALAFAAMLRSIKIPSRIAVGFFINPEEERFGFYPVRSGSAHAWVEIFFPEYGWIEFDPTTELYAEDELEPMMFGALEDNFEQLMKEILENREKLKPKAKIEEEKENMIKELARSVIEKSRPFILPLLALIIICAIIILRFRFYWLSLMLKDPRKKTLSLWRNVLLRLRINKVIYKKRFSNKGRYQETSYKNAIEAEWVREAAARLPVGEGAVLNSLYCMAEKARYANQWSSDEAKEFIELYKKISFRKYDAERGGASNGGGANGGMGGGANKSGGAKALLIFLAFGAALFIIDEARAQEDFEDANELYDKAREAVYSEYWERAISLFNLGKKTYPDDWRFPEALGNLYFERELYNLAKEEYLAAYKIVPDYLDIIHKLALSSGSLNQYEEAAFYFEKYLSIIPNDVYVTGRLGWMYLKLHRFEDGVALIKESIETQGLHYNLAMILAALYSSMMKYDDARYWYAESINAALALGAVGSQATIYYNWAILESKFYQYDKSLELSEKSLRAANFDIGHMMLGELSLRRFEVLKSFSEYQKAFELDKRSPLPKLSLAQVYFFTGRLDEALLYTLDCLKATNHAWMFHFDINENEYARDLHEILWQVYLGLYNREKNKVYGSFKESILGFAKKIEYLFKYSVHKKWHSLYALKSAELYKHALNRSNGGNKGGEYLDALSQFYAALNDYPSRALYYLELARDYETALIPEAKNAYLYEEGKIKKSISLLEEALYGFDDAWQKDNFIYTLIELQKLLKDRGRGEEAGKKAEELYSINPGALLQNNIALPIELGIEGTNARNTKRILGALKNKGFKQLKDSARYLLKISLSDGDAIAELYDSKRGGVIVRERIELKSFDSPSLAAFSEKLKDAIFYPF